MEDEIDDDFRIDPSAEMEPQRVLIGNELENGKDRLGIAQVGYNEIDTLDLGNVLFDDYGICW